MNWAKAAAAAGLLALLAGCQADSNSIVGSVVSPAPRIVGGLVGNAVGRSLDAGDRGRALAAEYRALEFGRTGATTPWSDSLTGRYGEVVPGTRYQVNDTTCREYVHVIVADGRSETGRGTACRGTDGSWRTVS
jgi:surface antigen